MSKHAIRSGTIVRVKIYEDIPENLAIVFSRERGARAYVVGEAFGHIVSISQLEILQQTDKRTYDTRMAALQAYKEQLYANGRSNSC